MSQDNKLDNIKNVQNNNNYSNINSLKDKYQLIQKSHPLEFYALGKYNKNLNNSNSSSSIFYNTSSLSSPRFRVNNSSHGLFDRNILSTNTSFFDNLKQVKNNASLTQLNRNEINYLNPLLIYKIRKEEKKEGQKRNNINSLEWLNIIKNKLYSIDVNSRIKNGQNISRNQFYEQKKRMFLTPRMIDKSIEYDNSNNSSYQIDNKNNLSDGFDYDYNTNQNGSYENIFNCKRFKKENEKLNKLRKINIREKYSDYWKKLRIEKSHSTDALIKKDFKNLEEKPLKFNKLNYNPIKNWWKIEP